MYSKIDFAQIFHLQVTNDMMMSTTEQRPLFCVPCVTELYSDKPGTLNKLDNCPSRNAAEKGFRVPCCETA